MSRLTTALLPLILMVTLVCTSTATAKEFKDVNLPDQYELAGQSLQLNGQGMRKKFFFSIYVGALYTPTKVTSSAEVMKPEMPKVVRMIGPLITL